MRRCWISVACCFLGQAEKAPAGTTVQVDLGMDLPRLRPGVPYYLSSHLYADNRERLYSFSTRWPKLDWPR